MKNKVKLIIAMLIFGSIGLFVRYLSVPSSYIAMTRGLIGTIFLLVISLIKRRKIDWEAIRQNKWKLIISGGMIGFNWMFLFEAYRYTTIANATLCYYFAPVFVTILAPFVLKEPTSLKKGLSIVGAMIGMALIIMPNGVAQIQRKEWIGLAFGISAACLYASIILTNKRLKQIGGVEMTIVQLFMAAIVLIPYSIRTTSITELSVSFDEILILLILGIVHTGIAYMCYFSAVNKLKSQETAILSYIDPVSAIVMSWIFLSEPMGHIELFGGCLILCSTMISELTWKRK